MRDRVSSRQIRDASSAAALAVIWLACTIFSVPYGSGWMGPGWMALAVSVALWVGRFAGFDSARRPVALPPRRVALR
jgi:hypothetical protein